jgi:hypothetical protein
MGGLTRLAAKHAQVTPFPDRSLARVGRLAPMSLTQTGRGLVDRGEMPEAALDGVPKEIPQADIDRWSIESDTPVGRLHHLGPTVRLSEIPPYWARTWVPLDYNEPARARRVKPSTFGSQG